MRYKVSVEKKRVENTLLQFRLRGGNCTPPPINVKYIRRDRWYSYC